PQRTVKRTAETANKREQLGVLQPKLHCTIAAHRKTRDRAVVTVGYRPKLFVDLRNQFLDDIAFVLVVRLGGAVCVPAVTALGSDNDESVSLVVFGKFRLVCPIVEVAA